MSFLDVVSHRPLPKSAIAAATAIATTTATAAASTTINAATAAITTTTTTLPLHHYHLRRGGPDHFPAGGPRVQLLINVWEFRISGS